MTAPHTTSHAAATLRLVRPEDASMLLQWRNRPDIVALGSQNRAVTVQEHAQWFATVLHETSCILYILELDGQAMGQVRFTRTDSARAEVSIYLLPEFAGRGLGTLALVDGCTNIEAHWPIAQIDATIRPDNHKSLRSFQKAGFGATDAAPDSDPSALVHLSRLRHRPVPHNRPTYDATDAQATYHAVLAGGWSSGKTVARLETRLEKYVGQRTVATSSGTSALRIALQVAGVQAGDEVLVPAYSCIALANAVTALGASVKAVDIAADSWCIDPQAAGRACTDRTRALIAVNTFGQCADIAALRQATSVPIIEDCAHGFALTAGQTPHIRGDIGITSFYTTKLIGAGHGGALFLGNLAQTEMAIDIREYADKLPTRFRQNDSMSDIHAALAARQMDRLDGMLEVRAGLAHTYARALADILTAVSLPMPQPVWYRFCLRLPQAHLAEARASLAALGADTRSPVHPWLTDLSAFPHAQRAYQTTLSLPLYPTLTGAEIDRVVLALRTYLQDCV